MSSAVRGAEEEVFETPDLAEDDPLEAEMLSTGNEPFLTGNREASVCFMPNPSESILDGAFDSPEVIGRAYTFRSTSWLLSASIEALTADKHPGSQDCYYVR